MTLGLAVFLLLLLLALTLAKPHVNKKKYASTLFIPGLALLSAATSYALVALIAEYTDVFYDGSPRFFLIVAIVGVALFYLFLKTLNKPLEHFSGRAWLLRALLTLAVIILFGYAGLGIFIIFALSGQKTFYLLIAFLFWLLLLYIFLTIIWRRDRFKRQRKYLFAIFLLCTLTIGGYYMWELQQEKIPVLRDRAIELTQYEPFKKSAKLARLEAPARFKITENLPRLDGAIALYPIMAAFVEATYPTGDYSEPQSDGKKLLRMRNTPGAYQALIDGEVDIIFVAAPSAAQKEAARKAGVQLKMTPIGKEAFVFFVNSQNPVTGLTVAQIQNIYSGNITNWQAVGGKNDRIKAFQRNAGSGSQSALERLMQGKPLMRPPIEERPGGMGGIVEMTADYKNHYNALGFSFRYFTAEMFTSNQIRLLAINDVPPNKDTIRNGSYPLTAEFYAVTAGSKNPQVQPFIDWMLSDEGQELIEKTGYVGLN